MCFVSRCGAKSSVVSILASAPFQHRSGHAIGRSTAHKTDVIVRGTLEELYEELEQAFRAMKGREGQVMRVNWRRWAKTSVPRGRYSGSIHQRVCQLD